MIKITNRKVENDKKCPHCGSCQINFSRIRDNLFVNPMIRKATAYDLLRLKCDECGSILQETKEKNEVDYYLACLGVYS